MANDVTFNPFVIDTATSSDLIAGQRIRIKSIKWVGGTTAGHAAVVTDAAGHVIWKDVATGANYVSSDLIENVHAMWSGLKVPTLASGVLYIEYA